MNNYYETENYIFFALQKIEDLSKSTRELPERKSIFRGSFDCWESVEDQIAQSAMPMKILNRAKELGYITNETILHRGKYNVEIWKLTEAGKNYLIQNSRTCC